MREVVQICYDDWVIRDLLGAFLNTLAPPASAEPTSAARRPAWPALIGWLAVIALAIVIIVGAISVLAG